MARRFAERGVRVLSVEDTPKGLRVRLSLRALAAATDTAKDKPPPADEVVGVEPVPPLLSKTTSPLSSDSRMLSLNSRMRPSSSAFRCSWRYRRPFSIAVATDERLAATQTSIDEAVRLMRQLWTEDGVSFEGEFYRHTLMTPFFSPPPNPYGPPPPRAL